VKKATIFSVIGVFLTATILIFTLNQCNGGTKGEHIKPFAKTSFDEVTAELNPGGNFYLYAGTERIIKTVEEFALKLRQVITNNLAGSPEEAKIGLKVFDLVYGMLKSSGLMEISGIGVSSIALNEKINHSKIIVHHYKENNKGLIWKLKDDSPHELNLLKMLPIDTAVAGYSEFKFNVLWDWIKTQANTIELPKLKQGILSVEPMLEKQGIQLDQMLDSLSGLGAVITLNNKDKKSIPMGGMKLEIPDIAVALIFTVKNDHIFNLIKSKLPPAQVSEEEGIKKIKIPIPPIPIPLTVEPVIIQKDNLLLVASNSKIVDDMYATQEKGNGLTTTEEFKSLSAHMPAKGNGFNFLSSRYLQTLLEIQKKILQAKGNIENEASFMEIFNILPKEMAVYGVRQHRPEGTVVIFNHTMNIEGLILMPATAAVGIVAAIAIPNMLTAMQKGKQKTTMIYMKTIGIAIESYMTDNYKAPEGQSLQDILPQLQPFYINNLPLKDGWGNDFHYYSSGKDNYFIGSGGKDGVFNGWEQKGDYIVREINGFNNDIIYSNGMFTYGPKVR